MGYHYFRHPKTTNEKRAWGKLEQETKETGFKVQARLKRNPVNLPCCYDDKSRQRHENWKHYRKTQYKTKS